MGVAVMKIIGNKRACRNCGHAEAPGKPLSDHVIYCPTQECYRIKSNIAWKCWVKDDKDKK